MIDALDPFLCPSGLASLRLLPLGYSVREDPSIEFRNIRATVQSLQIISASSLEQQRSRA